MLSRDQKSIPRGNRRFSLLELLLWMTGFSVMLSAPYWLGMSSLLIIFYGTLGVVTWRLSHFTNFLLALMVGFACALAFSAAVVPVIVNR